MVRSITMIASLSFLIFSANTLAEEYQTVILEIDNMTCSSCSYTVKKTLRQLPGVKKVEAKYEGQDYGWAKITFNPDKTSIERLIEKSTHSGYPARLKQKDS